MGRGRWNRKYPDKAEAARKRGVEEIVDPITRLVAVSPAGDRVAVAVGAAVRVVDAG